jgi:uncharacterized membrane protein YeiH
MAASARDMALVDAVGGGCGASTRDLLTTSTPPPPSWEVVEVVEVVSLTASVEVVWRWLDVVEVVTRTYRR